MKTLFYYYCKLNIITTGILLGMFMSYYFLMMITALLPTNFVDNLPYIGLTLFTITFIKSITSLLLIFIQTSIYRPKLK
jgi:hypothetical protein